MKFKIKRYYISKFSELSVIIIFFFYNRKDRYHIYLIDIYLSYLKMFLHKDFLISSKFMFLEKKDFNYNIIKNLNPANHQI